SLLRKYILYKKFKSSNYFKSFYYLELIKLEIGILPSSLELDYVKLFYLSGLYFYQPRQVLKYIDSFNLKQQNLIIEENIMSLLLGGDISKFPFKRTKQYRFAESILKGDRVEISNYICTNFDNYLEKSFFDVSLLLLSNIFYSTHRLEKECLYFKASRNVERFIVKSLFLILQNRSDEVDVNRLNYFKTVCKNQSVDFLLIVIHLFYVEAVSPNKLKAILIGYERSGYDFIIFKRYLLYYFYKIKNIKSFSKLFEDLSSLNLSFSNEFWLYYYSLGVDIDKIGVALNNKLMLKDYGNYVLIVRLVLNYSLTNNDMELLRKLVSHQNLSYNKQILETKVLTNPMQLRAFYAHFSLKP
ncbi:MAG: hypothetical protein VX875_02555, partial [Pseudomonadota bacterium]|nr:hypothetical protein [Pseudomonadota bacterium]